MCGSRSGRSGKKTSDAEKKTYHDQASKGKEKYDLEMVEYNKSHPASVSVAATPETGQKKRKKRAKDPNAPKRPMNGYFMFMKHLREETDFGKDNADVSHKDKVKLMGEKWAGLGDEGKKKWNDIAQTSKDSYDGAMAKYSASKTDGEQESPSMKTPVKEEPKEGGTTQGSAKKQKASTKKPSKDAKDEECFTELLEKYHTPLASKGKSILKKNSKRAEMLAEYNEKSSTTLNDADFKTKLKDALKN